MASTTTTAPPSDVERATRGSVGGRARRSVTAGHGNKNPGQRRFIPTWNKIFVASCVFAVLMDPLFFYSLMIDQDKMCLRRDKKLMITALVLRSLTDVIFTVHFVYQIDKVFKAKFTKMPPSTSGKVVVHETSVNSGRKSTARLVVHEMPQKINSWLLLSMIIDILSLLPIPHLIVLTFYKVKSSGGYQEYQTILNIFLLGQYLPRICRIHLSSMELRRNTGIWVKGLFNFFLYILASHVLGAFWYFFSIQRETSCWHSACVNHSSDPIRCIDTFYCKGPPTTIPRNITFFENHCPLDTRSGSSPTFHFGIFLDSLKNCNSEQMEFGKKFLYSFWWGLRNLSNFGTNLTTSTYVWENLFAILICIIGLLLFLYLIGNVQTFMQMEATKSEEIRRKIKMKKLDVDNWISRNGLPDDMQKVIMKRIKQKLKENKDADLQNFFHFLPGQTRIALKRCLCMTTVKKVPMLEKMNTRVLEMICDHLKPVKYSENSFVFRMGDPLDCMIFITQGTIWTYCSSSTSDITRSTGQTGTFPSSMAMKPLGKGQFYGQELLNSAPNFTQLPVSTKHVRTQTKVEAFALMAKDLETVVSKCQLQWDLKKNANEPQDVKVGMAISTIKTVVRHRFTNNNRRPKKATCTIDAATPGNNHAQSWQRTSRELYVPQA